MVTEMHKKGFNRPPCPCGLHMGLLGLYRYKVAHLNKVT